MADGAAPVEKELARSAHPRYDNDCHSIFMADGFRAHDQHATHERGMEGTDEGLSPPTSAAKRPRQDDDFPAGQMAATSGHAQHVEDTISYGATRPWCPSQLSSVYCLPGWSGA
jgi:hypothetical protein